MDVLWKWKLLSHVWLYIPISCWIIKKAKEFQKNIYFFCIDYAKAFNCVDHQKL